MSIKMNVKSMRGCQYYYKKTYDREITEEEYLRKREKAKKLKELGSNPLWLSRSNHYRKIKGKVSEDEYQKKLDILKVKDYPFYRFVMFRIHDTEV